MAKYGIGELVRFKASKLLVSTCSYFIKIGTDRLVGRVIGRVETAGEETRYYVEVKLPRSFSTSASGILGILGSSDITLRLSVLESQLQSEKEYLGSKFDATLVLEKWKKPIPNRYFMCADLSRPEVVASFQPSKEVLDSLREFARTGNVHHADGLVPADGGDKKMSKSRCVKLLKSYLAERDKVKKGRKFERRLRDIVVDEALERAIELLKGGAE